MNQVYAVMKMSKQNFHQMLKRRMYKSEEVEQLRILLDQVREDHPKMGLRDVYKVVAPKTIGRDQFERIFREYGYGVRKTRNFRKTTNSLGVTRFPNLVQDIEVTRVNQVWVSDITYFEMNNRFYYLTFIMDRYSREIIGFSASDNLRTENTTIPALLMAFRLRGSQNVKGTIFHSDGGGQYYCKEFLKLTRTHGLINSMAEGVYENAHAERLNGIIKNNYLYPYCPNNWIQLRRLLKKAVKMYNETRPHSALNGLSPKTYSFHSSIENENKSEINFPFPTE